MEITNQKKTERWQTFELFRTKTGRLVRADKYAGRKTWQTQKHLKREKGNQHFDF